MRRNISGQFVGAQLIAKADGTPVTSGTTTVYVTGDAGTQAAGSVGSGACTHEGNGFWTYAPAQAETNYTHVAFTFVNTSAINATVQIYPTSYDANGRVDVGSFGGTAGTFSGGRPEVNATHAAGTAWGSGAITAASIASSAITAAKFAADAIDANALATNAAAEIAGAVWDVDATTHQTQGTFGQAIGDPVADTNTIYKAVVTDATGATVGVDAAAILADTGTDGVVLATGSITAAVIATDAIDADALAATAGTEIGTAVWATAARTLTANTNLNDPTAAAIADAVWDEALSGHLGAGSTGEALNAAGAAGDPWTTTIPGAYGAGSAGYIVGNNLNATVSSRSSHSAADVWAAATRVLTAATNLTSTGGSVPITAGGLVSADVTAISTDTAAADNLEAAADGAGYNLGGGSIVAASVTGAVGSVTGNVGGNVAGSVGSVTGAVGSVTGAVGSVTGAVGSVTGNVGGNVTGSVGSLATQAKADVNAEVVDALSTDAQAEPTQGAPAANASLAAKINYLYKAWRNKSTQTATQYSLYNDDTTTLDHKATVSDDATTFTKGEVGTGA